MPFDGKGKHHLNTQKAMASDRMPPRPAKAAMPAKPGEAESGVGNHMPGGANENDIGGDSSRTIITHHDDGTHSVQHADGDETPQGELEDALEMIRAKHGMQREVGEPRHGMPMHEHALQGL